MKPAHLTIAVALREFIALHPERADLEALARDMEAGKWRRIPEDAEDGIDRLEARVAAMEAETVRRDGQWTGPPPAVVLNERPVKYDYSWRVVGDAEVTTVNDGRCKHGQPIARDDGGECAACYGERLRANLRAASIEGARLALEAAKQAVRAAPVEVTPNGVDGAMTIQNAVNAIDRLDPVAIVKP